MDGDLVTKVAERSVGSIENDVLIGLHGQLFLARGGHSILEVALGQKKVEPASFEAFRVNIAARRVCADRSAVPYLHVIFPDKQSVLVNDYVISDPVCLGEQYLAACPEAVDCVFYPLELLRGEGPKAFLRTDTHMSERGTVLTVCRIAELLTGADQSGARQSLLASLHETREWIGDLGGKLEPKESCVDTFATKNWDLSWFHNDLTGGNNGIVDIYFNQKALYNERLLWFGDSFGREAARFLSVFFSEIVFLRTPYFHEEMFDAIRPSIMVTENVERYLGDVLRDANRPSFFMFPHLSGLEYRPSRAFAEAFSAMLSAGRAPYGSFRESLAEQHSRKSQAMDSAAAPQTTSIAPLRGIEPMAAPRPADGIIAHVLPSSPSTAFLSAHDLDAKPTETISFSIANQNLARSYGVQPVIRKDDFIYRFVEQRNNGDVDKGVTNYLELGKYSAGLAVEMVAEITRLKSLCRQSWHPARILDFASGFGCVARHLPAAFPDSAIMTSDIHPQAVRFNQDVLRLDSILSARVPEELRCPEQDVIFAMSFFSHLPRTTFVRWVRALGELLSPGGALVFTANGATTHALGVTGVTVEADGFGFAARSEQLDLDSNDYGITISYPRWLLPAMSAEVPALRLAHFREAHWWAIQDTYVFVRS